MSLSRALLLAVNPSMLKLVTLQKKALNRFYKTSVKLTDSQITLHWLYDKDKTLKLWTRKRVKEIKHSRDIQTWCYVQSSNIIADIEIQP